jgi:hypothetical protein
MPRYGNLRELKIFCCNVDSINYKKNSSKVDCVWDEEWLVGECSTSCGDGVRNKNRVKLVQEEFGGFCEGSADITEVCNSGDCPPRKTY